MTIEQQATRAIAGVGTADEQVATMAAAVAAAETWEDATRGAYAQLRREYVALRRGVEWGDVLEAQHAWEAARQQRAWLFGAARRVAERLGVAIPR